MERTMPRFVILIHDSPFLHWDLLLEAGSAAHTWRLLREPVAGEPIAAERLPDHRLQYLDYEGPVSGDRGHVRRVMQGTYECCEDPTAPDSSRQFRLGGESPFQAAEHRITADGREFWHFVSTGPVDSNRLNP